MKTIVSVTPLSVTSDSRTYKIAASFVRFGYRSIVVEGYPSSIDPAVLPFELRVAGSALKDASYNGVKQLAGHTLIDRIPKVLKIPGQWAKAVLRYSWDYGIRVARALPFADLYYVHGPYQFPGVYSVAKRIHAPIVYDAHDFYPLADQTPFLNWVEALCIRKAHSVITVSSGIAELLSEEYGCRSIVLRNAHDGRLDKNPAKGLRQILGLGTDQFLLVNVGQAKSGQHIEGALAALATLPPSVHLAFVGKNTNRYREQISKCGIGNRVHLVPAVRPEEVVPFIESADAALLLYFSESLNFEYSLPNRFFQAIAASLPLLYPNLREIRTVAERFGLGILIDPFSAESIKTAVLQLLDNSSRHSACQAAARLAEAELSWENEEPLLKEVISRALSKGSDTI